MEDRIKALPDHRNLPISNTIGIALLLMGLLTTGWLRYHVSQSDPLWLDELQTVWTVSKPIGDVSSAAADGNQAPSYFWLMKGWIQFSGTTAVGFRLFSIVCSLLTAASLGYLAWHWSRSLTATNLTLWLYAIDPLSIFYGSEARPYALLMLLSVWQFFMFLKCMNRNKDEGPHNSAESLLTQPTRLALVTLGSLTFILLLTHYTGVLLIGCEFLLALLISLWQRAIKSGLTVGFTLTISTLSGFAIQWNDVRAVLEQRSQWQSFSSVESLVAAYLPSLIGLIFIPVAILIIFSRKVDKEIKNAATPCLYVLAWSILPALLAGCIAHWQLAPLAIYRYTLTGAVALPLFAGLSTSILRTTPNRIGFAVFILLASIFSPIPSNTGEEGGKTKLIPGNTFLLAALPNAIQGKPVRLRFESWNRLIRAIHDSGNEEQPIFLFANLLEDEAVARSEQADESSGNLNTLSADRRSYLKFPLTHASILSEDRVRARPTHSGTPFSDSNIEEVIDKNGCWIILRGDPATVSRVVESFDRLMKNRSIVYQSSVMEKNANDIPEWLSAIQIRIDSVHQ